MFEEHKQKLKEYQENDREKKSNYYLRNSVVLNNLFLRILKWHK